MKMGAIVYTPTEIAKASALHKPAFNVPWRPALQKWATFYTKAAAGTLVEPCMLAAIVARESGGQNILQYGVPPGPDCGVGLAQITYGVDWSDRAHPKYPGFGYLLDPLVNLSVSAKKFLEPALEKFPDNHRAAFAAYNLGPDQVALELAQGLSPDAWTTNHDYGTDVFTDWINFSAASMNLTVTWAGFA